MTVATELELEQAVAALEAWTERLVVDGDLVAGVERDGDHPRFYVRIQGETKSVITVWLTVRDRSVHAESYFLLWPPNNVAEVFEYLLRCSAKFVGMRFVIGDEDAIFLRGEVPISQVLGSTSDAELDRLLGSIYDYTERCFQTAAKLAFTATK